jgi:PAS domain-containing protein
LRPNEPRPLHRGWPLHERRGQFELGCTFDSGEGELVEFAVREALGQRRAGWWECELADNSLTWTSGVYDIFGLPQGARVTRDEAVALYFEESRAAMERLRSYAIAQGQGFVLDAQIRPAGGGAERWMRLIGAPSSEDGNAARLHGLKLWL